MKLQTRSDYRQRRHLRVRQKVKGSAARPRMSVFISNRHMYVQFVDDIAGRTLAAVSTLGSELKGQKLNVETAQKLGALAAQVAKEKGVTAVVFDRGGFAYGGRLRALADAARGGGLQF